MAADKLCPHHPEELAKLLRLAQGCRSILEIGSRYGETLRLMATVSRWGARVVAVDLPGVFPWGEKGSEKNLIQVVEGLRKLGYDARVYFADSKKSEIVEAVRAHSPFDLVFIDGDHTYAGAKADWLNYGPMGKTIVFHDIRRPAPGERQELEVWRLWDEIHGEKEEFYGADSKMGLGIVHG